MPLDKAIYAKELQAKKETLSDLFESMLTATQKVYMFAVRKCGPDADLYSAFSSVKEASKKLMENFKECPDLVSENYELLNMNTELLEKIKKYAGIDAQIKEIKSEKEQKERENNFYKTKNTFLLSERETNCKKIDEMEVQLESLTRQLEESENETEKIYGDINKMRNEMEVKYTASAKSEWLEGKEKMLAEMEKRLRAEQHEAEQYNFSLRKKESALEGKEKEVEILREAFGTLEERELKIISVTLTEKKRKYVEIYREIGKISTGIDKLDESTINGYPKGSNIIVVGPGYSGKHMFAYQFINRNLDFKIPCIVVTTNQPSEKIKNDLSRLSPNFSTREEEGLIKFMDFCAVAGPGLGGEQKNIYYFNFSEINEKKPKILEVIDELSNEIYSKNGRDYPCNLVIDDAADFLSHDAGFFKTLSGKASRNNGVSLSVIRQDDEIKIPEMDATIRIYEKNDNKNDSKKNDLYSFEMKAAFPLARDQKSIKFSYIWTQNSGIMLREVYDTIQ